MIELGQKVKFVKVEKIMYPRWSLRNRHGVVVKTFPDTDYLWVKLISDGEVVGARLGELKEI